MTLFQAGLASLIFLGTQVACAGVWKTDVIYSGGDLREVNLRDIAASIKPGTVVIVSENHDFKPHHRNQVSFLEALAAVGHSNISVGMEFLSHDVQGVVDRFLSGAIAEPEFLKEAGWGENPFEYYRDQVLFPPGHGGMTLAINARRALTSRIAKVGLAGLTAAELSELPPGFTLGNAGYFERFKQTMDGHVPPMAISRYFEAQSTWDETMAWVTTEYLKSHPEQIFVIVVGDFHAIYGGGLPDRLRARGANVVTVSQVNLSGLTSGEEDAEVMPDAKFGPRAEYIWISR
jgi:uncharacterized iron-regulated protein